VKNKLEALKKEVAPGYKTKVKDIRNLTDEELFRILKYHDPSLTSLEDLTLDMLEEVVKGE